MENKLPQKKRLTYALEIQPTANPATPNVLSAYVAVFNQLSVGCQDGYQHTVRPGAFDAVLSSGKDIVALTQHNTEKPLGRISNGKLKLSTDSYGLLATLELGGQSYALDLLESVKRGDLTQCSIGFFLPPTGFHIEEIDGQPILVVTEIDLFEVSIGVTFPFFDETSIEIEICDSEVKQSENKNIKQRATYMAKYFDFLTK